MSDQTRTLVLLRHAKSAYPNGVPDHDRPLAPRGRREAGLAG
ncbi:MAG TPA: histidine phosphatase family protein, partial [Mycobacterium sp.]|nr:histidine phosphatase family protein [Mycobacterium sp.]